MSKFLPEVGVVNGKPAVTSLDVAEAFEREHFHILRDIEKVLSQVSENFGKTNFGLSEYEVDQGIGVRKQPMYILTKDGFTLLTMGYSGEKAMEFKEAYIQCFNEMEERLRTTMPALPNFKDPIEAAKAWIVAEQARIAEQERADFYQRTKAQIGNRREATAMATASVAVRKANDLENKLGEGKTYKQVKAIPWLLDEFEPSRSMYQQIGKKLKSLSVRMGYDTITVPCPEYPEGVKAYHTDVVSAFYGMVQADLNMLGKYRKRRAA